MHRLTDSPTFRWPVRVYYEDTDAGGVVYHANYLLFMERARTEWLRALGFEQDALRREAGVQFSVRRATIDYLRPALFNDLLTVTVALTGTAAQVLAVGQRRVTGPCYGSSGPRSTMRRPRPGLRRPTRQ